ncbi:MAG TPA: type I-B CRISPR-associated protein Cas5b [Candidatus Competibacteraceae bacterium]|nr:type I-B CRISPR-associated protein Cas5b [Candidatus Competibacteraceae bacterium]
MRTLVFDVAGEYGQFKRPYSPMSPVSYPFPPPTAVLGMLGAIAGYAKDDYHDRLGWRTARIGIALQAPVRTFHAAVNLLQTKDGVDSYFRPRAGQNTHTQIPFEFLRQPRFRLYVAGLHEAAMDRLADQLASGRTAYTVSLGLASCLADVDWVGEWQARPLDSANWSCSSVVPLATDVTVHYADGRHYHRLRVPVTMDSQRIVHRYQEVVAATDTNPITGRGGQGWLYAVGDAAIAFLSGAEP